MRRSPLRGYCRPDIRGSVLAVRLLKSLLAVAAALLVPCAALADGSPRRLAHYTHQSWTEATGAPAPVLDMAQGPDGFLWLATGEGLFRFDGISFERIVPEGKAAQDDYPTTVFVARNRDVWTAFKTSRRFAVYRDGVLRVLDAPRASAWIMTIAEGPDGALWALTASIRSRGASFSTRTMGPLRCGTRVAARQRAEHGARARWRSVGVQQQLRRALAPGWNPLSNTPSGGRKPAAFCRSGRTRLGFGQSRELSAHRARRARRAAHASHALSDGPRANTWRPPVRSRRESLDRDAL